MSFSWTRVGAILRKELRDYRRNRTAQLRDLVQRRRTRPTGSASSRRT